MHQAYKDRAAFLFVYIREAHPTDEWQVPQNESEKVLFPQPKTIGERTLVAESCSKGLNITMPVLVDEIDNRADNLYAGWPERIYVVDRGGKIAYAGKLGPWGFKPEEVQQWLEKNVGKGN